MSDEKVATGLVFKQRLLWLILIAGFWFIADQYHKYIC